LDEQYDYLPLDVFRCLDGYCVLSNPRAYEMVKSYRTPTAAMMAYRVAAEKVRHIDAAKIIRKIDSLVPTWRSHFPDEESEVSIPRRELMVMVEVLKQKLPEAWE